MIADSEFNSEQPDATRLCQDGSISPLWGTIRARSGLSSRASVSSLTRKYVHHVGIFAATCNAAQTRGLDPVTIESAKQEPFMNIGHAFVFGTALSLFGHIASAQDVSRYRGYVLESSVESVVGTSGARSADAKTIHERPAKIQELEWRAPYVSSGSELADPVRGIVFTFLDDALYQVVVSYDRDRTDGLTNNDIIDTLTAAYGAPVLRSAKQQPTRPAAAQPDTVALAQWETAGASLTLVRGTYTPEFQLILTSRP